MRRVFLATALLSSTPAAAQTQADLNQMAAEGYTRADAAMNAQYRATMAALKARDADQGPDAGPGPSHQDALLASQRAWLAWRDAECHLAGYRLRGGSAEPMETFGCRERLTEQRTEQLKGTAR